MNQKNKTLFVLIIILVLIGGFFFKKEVGQKQETATLSIGNTILDVEIADTPEKRTRGLSNKKSLKDSEGMFFIFDTPGNYGFWMKDMNFPLDIIWLNEKMTIVGISENILPNSYPKTFYPPGDVLFVLEINANLAEKLNIEIDEKAVLNR